MDPHFALYLVFFVCYAGLLALSLAMDRHHSQIRHGKPAPLLRRALRLAGWSLLALALWLCSLACERATSSSSDSFCPTRWLLRSLIIQGVTAFFLKKPMQAPLRLNDTSSRLR